MGTARRSVLKLISLWVLLATICAHALSPGQSSLTRSSGSAFSYHTSEVSLGPKRVVSSVKAKAYDESAKSSPPTFANLPSTTRSGEPQTRIEAQRAWQPVEALARGFRVLEPYAPRAPPIPLIQA